MRGRERAPAVVKMLCVGDLLGEDWDEKRYVLKMKI
jgi:hypothetical protein